MSGRHSEARHLRFHNWITAFVLNLLVCVGAFAAQITGTVTNATTNKPSSGDEVVLLSLANGMDEVAKTKTDSQGRFTLNVPDEGAQHLVRVTRQSVNYFKAAPPGTATVDTTVYDASTQVEGLVTEARVFRLQASGGSMDVRESYVLNNQSQPPRSKIGNQTFAITLPDGAGVGEASLTGPSGMPVTVAAVPSGAKNRYAYDFPIRPGQTRFELTYKLPYSGSYEFSLKPEAQLNELGVLLPKSMKFAGISGGFAQDVDEAGLAVFFAKNVPANQEVRFSVSGEGLIPNETPGANAGQPSGESGGTPIPISSGGSREALWFIAGTMVILIGGGAFVMWRKRGGAKAASKPKAARAASKARAQAQSQAAKPRQGHMLDVLKDELFQLENDRLNGKVSQEEYEKSKAGLDTLFRRQMKNR
jgi:hypothetical protein